MVGVWIWQKFGECAFEVDRRDDLELRDRKIERGFRHSGISIKRKTIQIKGASAERSTFFMAFK